MAYFIVQGTNASHVTKSHSGTYTNFTGKYTLKADSGYKFTKTPTYKEGTRGATYNFSTTTTGYEYYTYLNSVTENLYVDVDLEKERTKVSITKNLTNCTLTTDVSSVYVGDSITLTLSANDGYKFVTAPTFSDETFSISEDGLTATLSTTAKDGEIVASAILIPVLVNITTNLTNCTLTTDISSVYVGDSITLTLSANDGYKFVTAPTFSDETFSISEDGLTATLSTTAKDGEIVASANNILTVTTNIKNATLEGLVENVASGELVSYTLTPNDKYEFSTTPYINYGDTSLTFVYSSDGKYTISFRPNRNYEVVGIATAIKYSTSFTLNLANCTLANDVSNIKTGDVVKFEINANSNYVFTTPPTLNGISFVLDSDTKATLETTITEIDNTISASAYAYDTDISLPSGYFHIYLPTTENLATLKDTTFKQLLNDIDVSKYITKMYFTNIPITSMGNSEIYLGNYPTGVNCIYTDNATITLQTDFTVSKHSDIDIFNYSPYNELSIYLPYVGIVEIDPSLVIGHSCKLVFCANIYSMYCTYYLYCNNVLVGTYNGVCGYELPFYINSQYRYNENRFTGNFDDLQARIIHKISNYANNGFSEYGNDGNLYYDNLANLSGFNKISNIKFAANGQITNTEKEEIISLLANGVYF